MKKNSETRTISDLLNDSIFNQTSKNRLNGVVKQSTIFSFWDNIVGAKFSKFTKPYSIKYQKIYVSVKSPVVAQELSLYKNKILKKVNSYSQPLGIEIKDIIFNYKNFHSSNPIASYGVEDKPVFIDSTRLNTVKLSSSTQDKIKEHVGKIKFLNENQKDKLVSKILSTYQANELRKTD